jgi:Flp pilus assembly protein TadG
MLKKLLASYLIGDTGAAAVEFAFVAPVLILIVLGVADYGRFMNINSMLFGSTRAGAEYVLANWNTNPTTVVAGAEQQICSFLGAGSCSSVTPSVTTGQCSCATSGASATCPGPTDPNPCGTDRLLIYVGVQASYQFKPTFIVSNLLGHTFNFASAKCSSAGNSNGGTMCPTTWVRVQ